MQRPLVRRDLLKRLGTSIVFGPILAGSIARSASAEEICADPRKMDGGATELLTSLNYAEVSPDPAKTCSICAFFTGGAEICGKCQILSGPVNGRGHCDSWGPKG